MDPQIEVKRLFKQIWPDAEEMTTKCWESKLPTISKLTIVKIPLDWEISKRNTDKTADRLFRELKSMPASQREKLIIVGHSLGGNIGIKLLTRCARAGIRIRRLILLAAAIFNDTNLSEAMKASEAPIISLVNTDDFALFLFLAWEHKYALGTGALLPEHPHFHEIAIPRTYSHSSVDYLYEFLRRSRLEDFRSSTIIVPRGKYSIVRCSSGAWQTLDFFGDWKLEKNIGSTTPDLFRIVFDENIMSGGSEYEMLICFNKIKSQIREKTLLRRFLSPKDLPLPNQVSHWLIIKSYKGWNLLEDYWTGYAKICNPDGSKDASGSLENMKEKFDEKISFIKHEHPQSRD